MNVNGKEIARIIEKFQDAHSSDLTGLMIDAKYLTSQTYFFAKEVGTLFLEYNRTHVQRKKKFAELVLHYKNERKGTNAEAERLAEIHPEYQKLYADEYELEARHETGKLMLYAIQGVIKQMQQEIAQLRREYNAPDYLMPN